MEKRITSTIFIGIFLVISLFLVFRLVSFNLHEEMDAYVNSANGYNNEQSASNTSELIMVISGFEAIGGIALVFIAYGFSFIVILNSAISLPFAIKNRKSSLKLIVVINYIYDVLLVATIVFCIIKVILFITGH